MLFIMKDTFSLQKHCAMGYYRAYVDASPMMSWCSNPYRVITISDSSEQCQAEFINACLCVHCGTTIWIPSACLCALFKFCGILTVSSMASMFHPLVECFYWTTWYHWLWLWISVSLLIWIATTHNFSTTWKFGSSLTFSATPDSWVFKILGLSSR